MSGKIRVAFATNDDQNINAHFGSAKNFFIHDISKERSELHDVLKIDNKNTDKTIQMLSDNDVDIVYFMNIGPTAAAKIINNKIFPIKYKESVPMGEEITKLVKMLNGNPAPFIKKILEKKNSKEVA
jgi:nitrogen fixation protein NifX